MTGTYPARTGMQHSLLSGNAPWGLPLRHEVLPSTLREGRLLPSGDGTPS